jgi:hypothetical protein
MKRRDLALGVLATLVLGVILGLSAGAMAPNRAAADEEEEEEESTFTSRSLKGTWGFSDQATIVPPAVPEPVPAVSVGILVLDGHGNCTGSDHLNTNGFTVGPRSFDTCTYSVNPDGTGSMTVTVAGDSVSLFLVIVDNKREFRFILSGVLVGGGVAKRQ